MTYSRFYPVGSHEAVVPGGNLAEALVGTAHLYHRVAVDAEVAPLLVGIFHDMAGRGKLC